MLVKGPLSGRAVVALVLFSGLLTGCIDKGYTVVVENHTGDALLGRATINDLTFGSRTTVVRTQQVVALPANSRLAVASEPFAGPRIELIEILRPDCSVIGTFNPTDGAYLVISDGPSIEVKKDFDQTADAGTQVPDCHPQGPLPTPSPSPVPGRIVGTTPADGATNVNRTSPIVVMFSAGPYTGWPTVTLRVASSGANAKTSISYDHDVRLIPFGPLLPNTTYVLMVETSASYTPIDKLTVHFTTGP